MANENMRDRLLARLPQPENLADYRNEVNALLEKKQKMVRKEAWYSGAIWVYVVLLGTALMTFGAGKPKAAEVGTFVLFFLIGAAVELLKYFISRSRLELLTEIKQVQLQVLELQASLRK